MSRLIVCSLVLLSWTLPVLGCPPRVDAPVQAREGSPGAAQGVTGAHQHASDPVPPTPASQAAPPEAPEAPGRDLKTLPLGLKAMLLLLKATADGGAR